MPPTLKDVFLFAGTSNPLLIQNINNAATSTLPNNIQSDVISKFNDGELCAEIKTTVRDTHCYVIQSICAPANDTFMELMLMADALRRSSAARITAVIPYFGYARQDRRSGTARTSISASVVAKALEGVGIDHIITMDLHAAQIQGFFNIPVDNLSSSKLFLPYIFQHRAEYGKDTVIVSPDVGGVSRARAIASAGQDIAIVDKRRPRAGASEVMNIIGNVEGRHCIIFDDIVDTAGTLCKAADALIERGGASGVTACITHGVLSGNALNNINNSKLSKLLITDSIPVPSAFVENCPKMTIISVADTLAQVIALDAAGESLAGWQVQ